MRTRSPVRPARPARLAAGGLLLLACTARVDPPDPARTAVPAADPSPTTIEPNTAPPPPTAPPPAITVPDDRKCGEAGDLPTELPPLLAAGRLPIGSGVMKPDSKLTLGTAQLRYDSSTFVGTRRAGHHAPGLHIEIDRAEVGEHAPWGTMQEVHPDRETHVEVGPYRFDLRFGPGTPPAEVTVAVSRDACPASAVIAPSTAPQHLWVSTEGIRFHTYDLQGQLLQLALDARGDVPRFDLSNLGYRHWFEPRPGPERRFRLADHIITLDRVVPAATTRFTDTWEAEGDARLSVRARIDAAPPVEFPAPVPSTSPCGDPSPVRTAYPPGFDAPLKVIQDRAITLGQKVKFGPLELDYHSLEIPAHGRDPYREEARSIADLQVFGGVLGGMSMSGIGSESRVGRLGHELLRVDADPAQPTSRLRARRVTLACAHEHTLTALTEPTYLWLSTVGHSLVYIKDGRPIPLNMQLYVDPDDISMSVSSEHGYLNGTLWPELVGDAFTFDGYDLEVVDIVTGPGTTRQERRFITRDLVPRVHVQLRVTPHPA